MSWPGSETGLCCAGLIPHCRWVPLCVLELFLGLRDLREGVLWLGEVFPAGAVPVRVRVLLDSGSVTFVLADSTKIGELLGRYWRCCT